MSNLSIGMSFATACEAEAAVAAYGKETFTPLRKRGCVTVDDYNKKVSEKSKLASELRYRTLHWECKHSGQHRPRGAGKRSYTQTYAKECPFQLTISFQRKESRFVVTCAALRHENHLCSEEAYKLYPDSRRPSGNVAAVMDEMVSVGGSAVLIAKKMHEKGLAVRVQDIYNRKRVLTAAGSLFGLMPPADVKLYPVVLATYADLGVRLVTAESCRHSLASLCCATLRRSSIDSKELPPGLRMQVLNDFVPLDTTRVILDHGDSDDEGDNEIDEQ